jgi:hypothetical protein
MPPDKKKRWNLIRKLSKNYIIFNKRISYLKKKNILKLKKKANKGWTCKKKNKKAKKA